MLPEFSVSSYYTALLLLKVSKRNGKICYKSLGKILPRFKSWSSLSPVWQWLSPQNVPFFLIWQYDRGSYFSRRGMSTFVYLRAALHSCRSVKTCYEGATWLLLRFEKTTVILRYYNARYHSTDDNLTSTAYWNDSGMSLGQFAIVHLETVRVHPWIRFWPGYLVNLDLAAFPTVICVWNVTSCFLHSIRCMRSRFGND